MQRLVVTFRGRVQGVGFRQTTVEIADRFSVAGTIQNLPNGDVELIAEGETEEIHEFIAAIEKRMKRNIDSIVRRPESATGKFYDFSIVR